MVEWTDAVAQALGQSALADDETEALLDLAREASRATADRRVAPLTTFLAGQFAATSRMPRTDAIARARDLVARALPAPPDRADHQ